MEERNPYELPIVPRQHQIKVEEARELRLIDLFIDEGNHEKQLSRADLILIYSLYEDGLKEFLDDYFDYVEREVDTKGYKVVNKPHFYLKSTVG